MENFFNQPYSTQQEDNPSRIIKVFLSYSSDCRDICGKVKDYIQDNVNAALSDYNVAFIPKMFDYWPPNLAKGTALSSSLLEVESSHLFICFAFKKHGEIREEEIRHAIKIYKEKTHDMHDVHIFFQEIPKYHVFSKEDPRVTKLRKKLEEELTYSCYRAEADLIKKISQIIIKTVFELRPSEHKERLLFNGATT